jgi:hypothetical protein
MRLFALTSVLALALGANAALTAAQATSNIDAITQKSADTREVANGIITFNAVRSGPLRYGFNWGDRNLGLGQVIFWPY